MKRAVLDTNVFVSGLISPFGPPGQILDMVRTGSLQPVVDDRILAEYHDVLHRPTLSPYFDPSEIEHILKFMHTDSHAVVCTPCGRSLPDANDITFLEVALTAEVTLITGNAKHFPPKLVKPAIVLTPTQYIQHILREGRH